MEFVYQFLATLSAGLFTGAAIYINLVEHPARMSCGTALAVSEFAPSYKRATVMQVTLAAVCFLSSLIAWLTGSGTYWLMGGILIVLVIPFTVIAILPTNKKLLSPSLDSSSPEAKRLLDSWNGLHAVRSLFSLVSFLTFLFAILWKK